MPFEGFSTKICLNSWSKIEFTLISRFLHLMISLCDFKNSKGKPSDFRHEFQNLETYPTLNPYQSKPPNFDDSVTFNTYHLKSWNHTEN